jgi:hypothetical protein
MVNWRRLLWLASIVALTAAALALALTLIALRSLAPRPGEWSHTLRFSVAGQTVEREVAVATLLRLASHPLAAPMLDGRELRTAQGIWRIATLPEGGLRADCTPCQVQLAALGPQPLVVDRAALSLAADGADRYHGELVLGAAPRTIVLRWLARFERGGAMAVDVRLPSTPLADAVQVLGRDMPERDHVTVRGQLSLAARARLPGGAWTIEPRLEGLEVDGLGTERLANLQRPAACRRGSDGGVSTLTGWLPRAVVAAEDQRFWDHPGYDLDAMLNAWQHNQREGNSLAGGSTITQQLAKLTVTGGERSASRKLRELLHAVEMERTLGKARILQLYLALAPWGEGVCGAERAVRVHLGYQDASTTGPLAAAWLASLLPAPDALLRAEQAAGHIDQARVLRVLDGMRTLRGERRERALDLMPYWTPAAIDRPRVPPASPAGAQSGESPDGVSPSP